MRYILALPILAAIVSSPSDADASDRDSDPRFIITVEAGNLKRLDVAEKDLSRIRGEYPTEGLKFKRRGNARVAFRLGDDGRVIDPIPGGIYTSDAFYQAAVKVINQLKFEFIKGSWSGPINRFVAEVEFRPPPCIPHSPWMNIDLQFTVCGSLDKTAKLEWQSPPIETLSAFALQPPNSEPNCNSPSTTLEINECLFAEFKEVDAKLNATYQRVLREFSKPDMPGHIHFSEAKESLVESQRAWIKYRDKDCYAVYALAVGASMRGQLSLQCKKNRTVQRIKELEEFLAL